MHKRNDTAFDDVASQGTEDTGDTESVATENSDCSATVAVSQQVQGGPKNRTVFWKFETPVYVDIE